MTQEPLLIGIDVGTGGSKVSVIDARASVILESRASYDSTYPQAGWVEQDPSQWLTAVVGAMDEAMSKLSSDQRRRIVAIGCTGPTHVAVLTDEDDRVVRPAIMWNDQRSQAQVDQLKHAHGAAIEAWTANAPSPTWTLPQLRWLADHEPHAMARVARIRFMKDWVRDQLSTSRSGVTDRVDAQGALLFDVVERAWSRDLADAAGVQLRMLPAVVEPSDVVDALHQDLARRWQLPAGVVLVAGTTDTAAELLAAGIVSEGDVALKLATAGNVARVARERPAVPGLLSYEHVVPGHFYWNSATSAAASALRWFRESFLPEGARPGYRELDEAVAGVAPGADGVIFTPFLNGERAPRFDSQLRAGFLGLTARHSWPSAARAVMEGVAFSLRDAASVYGALPPTLTLVGGGGRSAVWPQILADAFDRELVVAAHADSSIGAALVAGIGTGSVASYAEVVGLVGGGARRVVPDASRVRFYDRRFDDYLQFAEVTTALSHRLAADQGV